MTRACFRQWRHGGSECLPAAADAGGGYRLLSIDPAGEAAHLSFGTGCDPAPVAPTAEFALDLVQDSGVGVGKGGVVMLVAFAVPARLRDEVDRWYREEHVPLLMRAAGWHRARRFAVRAFEGAGPVYTSLAFHELADVSVLASPERERARSTPWRSRLRADGDWFDAAGRWLYRTVAAG